MLIPQTFNNESVLSHWFFLFFFFFFFIFIFFFRVNFDFVDPGTGLAHIYCRSLWRVRSSWLRPVILKAASQIVPGCVLRAAVRPSPEQTREPAGRLSIIDLFGLSVRRGSQVWQACGCYFRCCFSSRCCRYVVCTLLHAHAPAEARGEQCAQFEFPPIWAPPTDALSSSSLPGRSRAGW
jgi:hypothetical protein